MMKKIIIDVDPGIDDALALLYAIKSNKFDIKAITTLCGNSSLLNTTSNAKYILDLLNSSIPIYSGSEKPLARKLYIGKVHGDEGLGGIKSKKDPKLLNGMAVNKIIEIIKNNPNEITLIAIGPLTNIAKVIRKDKKTMNLLKEFVIMGGAINTYGNVNRVAEFNFFADPEAASIVINSGLNINLVPLNATRKLVLTEKILKAFPKTKLFNIIQKVVKPYLEYYSKNVNIKGCILHDPLTVGIVLNPSKSKTEKFDIQIETKGELTQGMCVVELRKKRPKPNVNVVMDIDSRYYLNDFIKTITKK